MAISVVAEKAFNNIQHSFMRNNSSKQGMDGNFLSLRKDMHPNLTASVVLNIERLNVFSQDQKLGKEVCSSYFYPVLYSRS